MLELRYGLRARPTKDIDLSLADSLGVATGLERWLALLARLRTAASRDLGDGFVIRIGEARHELSGPPGGGARFGVEVVLDGRLFSAFHLDVVVGETPVLAGEWIESEDFLDFAAVPAARVLAVTREQHFAEKVHAYTKPREATNTRVRDLVDMIILIRQGLRSDGRLSEAVRGVFGRVGAHAIPAELPIPPTAWEGQFAKMAALVGLDDTLAAGHETVARFWRPLALLKE